MRTLVENALILRAGEGSDWDESKHPRAENGQFGSAEHARETISKLQESHDKLGGSTQLRAKLESIEGQHRVSVELHSANGKIATTRELKGPVDTHKVIREMKEELKAEKAERAKPKGDWAPIKTRSASGYNRFGMR